MNQKYIKGLAIVLAVICVVGIAVYFILEHTGQNLFESRPVAANPDVVYSGDINEQHDLIIITDEDGYGFADKSGTVFENHSYDMASLANYGLYYVKKGKTQGFLNHNLKFVFETEEIISSNLREDFVIYKRNGKSGFINIKTGDKIEAVYDVVYDFSEGMAAIQKDGKIGFINTSGELVIPNIYYANGMHTFKNGLCCVTEITADGTAGTSYYINKTGQQVIDLGEGYGMSFYENRAFVKNGEMWDIIDENGIPIGEGDFGPYTNTVPGKFSGGNATVIKDGLYGVVNADGQYVIEPKYESLLDISGRRIVFKKGGKFGYMNIDGSEVFSPVYESLSNFKFGVAVYSQQNKYGLIREDGFKITNPEYKKIEILDNEIVKIYTSETSYFYTDKYGNKIWEPKNN